MNTRTVYVCMVAAISTLLSVTGIAQTKTGTTIGQFLLIEPSARIAAMGNAGVTTYSEVISVYYNPAAIAKLPHSDVQFTHSIWLADIAYDYAAAAFKLDHTNSIALSFTSLRSGEIDVRTVELPLGTGEKYTVSNIAIGLGYGRMISDRFSVGIEINYIQETIWHSSLYAVGINVGTLYRLSADGLHIGASISNFGTRSKYSGRDLRIRYDNNPDRYGDNSNIPGAIVTDSYPLPIVFRVGVGYPIRLSPANEITVVADAYHPSDNTESISVGAEWNHRNILFLRAGYQNMFQQDSEVGPTLGVGVSYPVLGYDVRFDYGWADHGRLGDTQRFTVGLAF
jgi:hypothetical protein